MKKGFFVLVALLMVLSMVAGCNSPVSSESSGGTQSEAVQSEGASTESVAAEPETITLLFGGSTDSRGIEAICAAAKDKLNINVEIEYTPSDGHEEVIKTRLATGDMSDIFLYNPGAQMTAINPEETMVPLGEEFSSRLDSAFVGSASYNGQFYGIPQGYTMAGGILYNKAVYQELGLSVPKTWDEFLANCDVIKQSGKTAIIGSFKDTWTAQLIFLGDFYNVNAADPEFASEFTANQAKFETTPAALRSWEKLSETKDYMNADYLATSYDVALEMLVTGQGAHYPMLTTVILPLAETYPEEVNNIGVFPVPSDDAAVNGLTVWPSASLHIYSGSEKIDACKRFLEFYLSDEGQQILMAAMPPSGPSHVIGVQMPDDVLPIIKDMLPYFESGAVTSAMEFTTPVKGANCPQICVECGSQNVTPEEAAKLYDDDCVKLAVQLGLEGW